MPAQKYNKDLLLVDSGDIHDGTGLTDGGPAGTIDGHEVRKNWTKYLHRVIDCVCIIRF